MGRYALVTPERKTKFQRQFFPNQFEWDEIEDVKEGDILSAKLGFEAGSYPVYTAYFMQAGLRVPFDPLLVSFLRRTHLHLSQVAPNAVRIIMGVAEANRKFGMQLDIWDIAYCYALSFSHSEGRWSLKGRPKAPALIVGLWDSCKYVYGDAADLKGDVEPDPALSEIINFVSHNYQLKDASCFIRNSRCAS